MKRYFRIMLGGKSKFAAEAYKENYIGMDFLPNNDLTGHFPDNWRDFNKRFIPVYMHQHPDKTKIAAGLACGALWSLGKGIQKGDIVLCPDGSGKYYIGEIIGEYEYHKDRNLPHIRSVWWFSETIERSSMSDALRNSAGSAGTISEISKHEEEINNLIHNVNRPKIVAVDETIEDPIVFALEKHLEAFLVQNWERTELGKKYNIFEMDGELVGQQYPSDTGPIDILAISKDKKELLVIELKKGRVSDNVVGQIQRYMGFVKEDLAEKGQTVKGVIIGLDDDVRIKRALSVTNNIEFYKYKINFMLYK